MRFDRRVLFAENSPDTLDWPISPREWPGAMSATGEVLREVLPLHATLLPAAAAERQAFL